jgi:hypothetical protein
LNTPHWQVNEEAIRIAVTTAAYGRFSSTSSGGGHAPSLCARTVKNMANSPAKNISSLDSHTIVPTLTMFGRFSECTRWLIAGDAALAAVTNSIIAWQCSSGLRRVARRAGHARWADCHADNIGA